MRSRHQSQTSCRRRRGSILVALVVMLVILSLIVIGISIEGAQDQTLSVTRTGGEQAFMAAASAANLAVKEMYDGIDNDGDGTIGSIANGVVANGPIIAGAQCAASVSVSGPTTTITATGLLGTCARAISVVLTNTSAPIEGFEMYSNGYALDDPNGWQPWDMNSASVAYVVNTYARRGSFSCDIRSTTDNVHLYTPTSGQWIYTAWLYIPSSSTGAPYFIMMNTYVAGGAKSWSVQVQFNLSNNLCANNLPNGVAGTSGTIVRDQWAPISVSIDLDAGTYTFSYNNQELFTDTWNALGGVRALAATDFYSGGSGDVYYDDIQLAPVGAGAWTVTGWQQIPTAP